MNVRAAFRQVRRYVRDYKIRAVLTTLGILVGVSTVVVFVILGGGLQSSVLSTVTGDNADLVYTGTTKERTDGLPVVGKTNAAAFTDRDVDALAALEGAAEAIPWGRTGVGVEVPGDGVESMRFHATTPGYFEAVRSDAFAAGEPYELGADEVVLNQQAAAALDADVGDELTVVADEGRVNATVTGIIEPEESVTQQVTGDPPKPALYGPPGPFYDRTASVPGADEPRTVYSWVFIVSASDADPAAVRERAADHLSAAGDSRHLVSEDRALSVTTREDWQRHVSDLTETFTGYLLTVSVVSLLVGAIGIANVMLVSVTQRVREVGVMRAMGANRRDVLGLFLLEAALLGLIGSVLGAGVGLAGGWFATDLLDLPYVVDPVLLVVAVCVGVGASLLAGAYPAWLASQLDPVEAIRRR